VYGAKAASKSNDAPLKSAAKPPPVTADDNADAAKLSTATMTNLDRMSTASSSTRRRAHEEFQQHGEGADDQHDGHDDHGEPRHSGLR
jgi:hypothetical protein